ncbi:cell division protein FtsH [Ichthyobacterium seriolicida]|uniref:ATP-dependent zinc metalloprotease FtsH n=2 Tax=Ichthyobacterium seriolicida TaxID=242600 RepID=A0A1J1E983_9FLAO|nr:cell division protein FtsH [Ichthyobacterium seriolicida]
MNTGMKSINTQEFTNYLKDGHVSKVLIINRSIAQVFLNEEALRNDIHKSVSVLPLSSDLNKIGPHYSFEIGDLQNFENDLKSIKESYNLDFLWEYETRGSWTDNIGWILPIAILLISWILISRKLRSDGGLGGGGHIFSVGKSKAKLFDENDNIKISFKDVAGLTEAKEEIQEIVDFLKNPDRYTKLGGKIPRGVLLIGSPGTGKTLLAKAVAGEAKVPFFSLSGSDFVEMFVGVGASRVRDLFKKAKDKSPCIIFIDEIDAIGKSRSNGQVPGGNDERENTLNQLLTEMDGFGSDINVIVMAATNRSDILDKALLRPGRFDRQIYVDLPELKERKEIFKVHLRTIKHQKKLNIDFLAKQTPGFSGADIANICNEAALIAARRNSTSVVLQHFLDAIDRVLCGLEKKNKIITPKERETISFHEAGHATVSWLLEHAAPLVKVTIVPRGKTLGAAWYLPEERQITTVEQILDDMCATLGGRAAEQILLNTVSTGALNDLEKVTKQAKAMVTFYGLSEKIGNVTYYDSQKSGDYNFTKPYSNETALIIDSEISNIIESQYNRALDILKKHKKELIQLSERLLKKEVLFKKDLEDIFGKSAKEKREEEIKNKEKEEKEKKEKKELNKEDKKEVAKKTERKIKDKSESLNKEETVGKANKETEKAVNI